MWFSRKLIGREGRRGQTSTEYVIVVSVLVVGMVAATSAFYDNRGPFHKSMKRFSKSVGSFVAKPPNGTGGLK